MVNLPFVDRLFTGACEMIKRDFLIRKLGAIGTAFVFWMVGFVIYQSLWAHSPPMTVAFENLRVERDVNGVRLKWDCKTKVNRPFAGHVHRSLVRKDNGEAISMPSTEFDYKGDEVQIPVKSMMLPSTLEPGEWCLRSRIEWTERMSLKESSMPGMNACFTVPPLEVASHIELARRVAELEKELSSHAVADFTQHAEMKK